MSAPIASSCVRRKVTSSGVIWLQGRSYYVSRRLAGQVISVEIHQGTVVIDVMVPLHKEYRLPRAHAPGPNEATSARRRRRA